MKYNVMNKKLELLTFATFVLVACGVLLANLCSIEKWLDLEQYAFKTVLTKSDRENYFQLLRTFQLAVEAANITYFLHYGSGLGVFRHHGMIPWDDDIDVLVDLRDQKLLEMALSRIDGSYQLHKHWEAPPVWKFCFSDKSRTFLTLPFKWPYLDIAFYTDNGTHIYLQTADSYVKRNEIFPLKRFPFGSIADSINFTSLAYNDLSWVPVQCAQPETRDLLICRSRGFSHLTEVPIITPLQKVTLCVRLERFSKPFVHSRYVKLPNSIRKYYPKSEFQEDILSINGSPVYRMFIEQPLCDGSTAHHSKKLTFKSLSSPDETPTFLLSGFEQ